VAVVQISRIQIRRGQKNQGSGLPQLASGEFGWAIDTQELYIGNGSVAEGAPQVGNTKVITEHDDLFELADEYTYRSTDGSIITGVDSANPVTRTLQDRLDDRVSVKAFGVTGVASQDCTVLLQRAIDQLYLNAGNEVSVRNRVQLYLEAGTYTIKDTIRIPPHATIIGAGAGKTIIVQDNPGRSIFTSVSDESIPGSYVVGGEFATQARNIRIEGLTMQVVDGSKGLVLESCRDSYFENLTIVGPWTLDDAIAADSSNTFDIGLSLNSKNGGVETVRNEFTNCHIDGFSYGVSSNWDINDNVFTTCNFSTLGYGVAFGKDMTVDGNAANGTSTGPTNNIFSDCVFSNIARQAILVDEGTYNVSRGNKFIGCGNDGGAENQPISSIIKYSILGNESINDFFTRTKILSYTQENLDGAGAVPYIPEVEGPINYDWGFEHEVTILDGDDVTLFRLPNFVNQSFDVEYFAEAEQGYNGVRSGKLRLICNATTDAPNGTPTVSVSDDYDYVGDNIYLDSISFDAILRDVDADATFDTIVVKTNASAMPTNARTKFKFKVKTKAN